MKRVILPALVALAFVSFDAAAQCDSNTPINQLQNLLPGKTVCAVRGTDRWQEEHRGMGTLGELWDYKLGPGKPIDPSKQLGSWSIGGSANQQVTYTYTAFGSPVSYTFEVHGPAGGPYNFCGVGGAQDVLGATIREGAVSCD